MSGLSASVGLAGVNRHADVAAVQRRLVAAGSPPGPVDGRFGRRTLAGILGFQHRFMREPDGRVDVHGPTWRRLTAGEHGGAHPAAHPSPSPTLRPTPRPVPRPVPTPSAGPTPTPGAGVVNYTDHLPMPAPESVNIGLRSPPNSQLTAAFGMPRESFTQDCQPATNARLKAAVVTESVGPFRVTGLRPAVESLRTIFSEVQRDHPDLYGKLGTAGMMCCRHVRGSATSISNHSWGTAIDMKVDGALVPWRASYVIVGLAMIAPYFNRHGWFWGAGYRRSKDAHHFECGADLIASFQL